MDVPGWLWAATIIVLIGVITIDLILVDRRPHPFGPNEALRWVIFYVAMAALFAVFISVYFGLQYGGQFVAGYLMEYSLSVDNLFVFMVIMGSFAVPPALQHRVLLVGIVIALFLRGILIVIGAELIERFSGHLLPLRRLPAVHGVAGLDGGGRGARPERQRLHALDRVSGSHLPALRRHQADHADRRAPGADPDGHGDAGDRHHRPALRPRQHPGRVRHHQRGLPGVRRQRVRADGPAPALLPAPGAARPAPAPQPGAGDHPGLHRRQARARGDPRDDQPRRAGDPGLVLPRVHRRRADCDSRD